MQVKKYATVTMVTIMFYAIIPLLIHDTYFVVLDFTLHHTEHCIQCDPGVFFSAWRKKKVWPFLIQAPQTVSIIYPWARKWLVTAHTIQSS